MIVWLYYLLLLAVLLAGLFLVLFTLPGLWLMTLAAGIYALLTHFHYVGFKTLLFLLILCFAAEAVEIFLGGAAAKKAGGGKRAMIGGLVGGIVGGVSLTFIPIPVISTIFGICLGSFLGAAGFEFAGGAEIPHSLRVGVGAAKGRFMGIVAKLLFGLFMFIITFFIALPIGAHSANLPAPKSPTTPATLPAKVAAKVVPNLLAG